MLSQLPATRVFWETIFVAGLYADRQILRSAPCPLWWVPESRERNLRRRPRQARFRLWRWVSRREDEDVLAASCFAQQRHCFVLDSAPRPVCEPLEFISARAMAAGELNTNGVLESSTYQAHLPTLPFLPNGGFPHHLCVNPSLESHLVEWGRG